MNRVERLVYVGGIVVASVGLFYLLTIGWVEHPILAALMMVFLGVIGAVAVELRVEMRMERELRAKEFEERWERQMTAASKIKFKV